MPSKKRSTKTTAKIIDDCAVQMQKLVRLKAADHNGFCKCVTCGKVKHWSEMQGAHFIERGKLGTKIMEENIHPSCQWCNMIGDKHVRWVKEAYSMYMRDMYGEEFVKEMLDQSKQVKKYGKQEALDMLADLKARVKEQEEQLNSLRPTNEENY